MHALNKVLAILASAAVPTGFTHRSQGKQQRLKGSHQRTVHYSAGGNTLSIDSKRSKDRSDRRCGVISARQQRIERKRRSRIARVYQQKAQGRVA